MFTLTNVCINVLSMFVRAVRDMGCISTPAIYWQQEVSRNSSLGYVLFFEVRKKNQTFVEFPLKVQFSWAITFIGSPLTDRNCTLRWRLASILDSLTELCGLVF